MPFKKGQSGNPSGRKKGSVSIRVALKNLLEEVIQENLSKAKQMLESMLDDPKEFKWLCEQKMQFELKQMPTKVAGEDENGNAVPLVVYLPQVKSEA